MEFRQIFAVILLAWATTVQAQQLKFPYCTPTNGNSAITPAPNGKIPPLPTLSETYQTNIEVNLVDRGYSIDATEYFDNEGNQGALRMVADGMLLYIIFSYQSNELFEITTGDMSSCKTNNLTTDSNTYLFGETNQNGRPHIFTTNGALRFGRNFGESYMGMTKVRGISVDHWQSCQFWKNFNAYFTVDYYFTMFNWTSGISVRQTPVRAWVQGVTNENGTLRAFNHYYDFFGYRPAVLDYSVFETPKGVVCPGRLVTKSVPNLAGQYYYRQEIINPSLAVIQQADVWYDSSYKLVRYDYRNLEAVAPYFTTDPLAEIHDYTTGVAYVINQRLGNCTVHALENNSFDVNMNFTETGKNPQFADQLRTTLQLFYLDNSYSYEGERTISGMLCDVFVSQRTDFALNGIGNFNSTFEYYFLSPSWVEIANPGTSVDGTVPVRLEITAPLVGYNVIYNFYDFAEEHPSLDNFDIRSCFLDQDKIDVQIEFRGDRIEDRLQKYFELQSRVEISRVAGISPIRVQASALRYDAGSVFYTATLLNRAPPSARFHKYAKQLLEYNNDKQIPNEGDEENCAFFCISETSFQCLSFDVCPSKKLCYLSKSTASDGTLIDSDTCNHYSRNVLTPSVDLEGIDEALAALKDVVYRNAFSFDIPLGNGQTQTYRAVDVRQDIFRSIDSGGPQLSGADYMKQYTAIRNKQIQANDDLKIAQVSVDDCAVACTEADLFICQSFEYNLNNGDCILSKIHPAERPELAVNAEFIDLYSRNYLYKFTKTPGTVMIGQPDTVFQGITDPNQCAKLCAGLTEFSCKSFEYCENIKGCVLGRSHKLDIPETTVKTNPSCDHYSRNYMDDFKFMKGILVALKNNQIIDGVSLDKCAKICADQGAGCMGFDYCGNDTMCRITSDSVKNIGQVTTEASSYCNHYTRQYYPDGSKVTTHSVQQHFQNSGKFTGGAMAGISIAMTIIGAVLTVLVFLFVLPKFKGTRSWNPATKMENM